MYIGIDLGSSAVKAVAVDETGACVASHSRPLTIYRGPGGQAEHRPADWESEAGACLRTLTAELGKQGHVPAAIAATGQMDGPVLLDAHLRPVASVQMWCDARCAAQCEDIESRISAQKLLQITGHSAVTGYTAPKLMWFAEHEPEVLTRSAHLIFPKDYLTLLLSGAVGSDISDASNSLLLDVRSGSWDESIVSALGLDSVNLPGLSRSADVVGHVSRQGAEWSGLPPGIPVAAGAGDSIAAALGAGLTDSSRLQIVVGSAGNVNCVLDRPIIDSRGRVHTGFFVDYEHWICTGVLQSAGASIQWWSDVLDMQLDEMVAEVEGVGPSGVFFAPYLAGERTPHLDARVRGGFVALEGSTSRADMTRAVLNGVACSFRDAAQVFAELGVHANEISITGGAARNETICRLIANVMQKSLTQIDADVTAMGAAMLAACAAGRFLSWQDAAAAWPASGEVFVPENAEIHEEAYQRFRQLYPRLAGW